MKAINLTGQAPTERNPLIDMIPLDTPLVIQIFPVYACNFRCNYCIFQRPESERHFISDEKIMTLEEYEEYLVDIVQFPQKLKVLRFVGIGEPLIHSEIGNMLYMAKEYNVTEKTEVITNGSLLNIEMSHDLIAGELDRLVISVQGTSKERYKEIAGIDINWINLIYNIGYFYRNKKETEVYIKIVDSALRDKEDEQVFYDTFGDICDYIAVETTVPIHSQIDLPERNKTQFGQDLQDIKVCPQPFYQIQINPDGNVVPCQSFEYPIILGNAKEENIFDIWNGDALRQFRRDLVNNALNPICQNCNMCKYRTHKEDVLDVEKLAYIMF